MNNITHFEVDDETYAIQSLLTVTGMIQMFAGATVPPGWLLCDGSSVATADYPELAQALYDSDNNRYIWGSEDSSHFNLPDLRGRVPIGAGTGTGLTPRTVGTDTIGSEDITLTDSEISHGHGFTQPTINQSKAVSISDHGASACSRTAPVEISNHSASHTHGTGNSTYGRFIVTSDTSVTNDNGPTMGSPETYKFIRISKSKAFGVLTSIASATITFAHNISKQPAFNTPVLGHNITQPEFNAKNGAVEDLGDGSREAHDNMQPSAVVNFIICTGQLTE